MNPKANGSPKPKGGYQRVLFPTSFSAASKAAQPHALEIALRSGARLQILTVSRPDGTAADSSDSDEGSKSQPENAQLEEFVRSNMEGVDAAPVTLRHERPAVAISDYTFSADIDLVVMGHADRPFLSRLLTGSVTHYVISCARCPVLVVRASDKSDYRTGTDYRNILAAVDFSENALKAAHEAVQLASLFDARVHFVHVVETRRSQMVSERWERFLEREMASIAGYIREEARERLGADLSKSSFDVRFADNSAFEGICAEASRKSADLIVVGRHGEAALDHFFLGSVSKRLVDEAPCPVMILPPEE